MNRRSFFATLLNASASQQSAPITMRRGARGENVSLLGYGAMRYEKDSMQDHIDYCIANGINYFDTAPVYCKGESEPLLGKCLSKHPRDKWIVATKLSNFAQKLQTFEASKALYEQSFKNLQTDHIDFYLLHSIGGGEKNAMKVFNARFIENGMLDFLLKEREAGRIRNLGFSFHGNVEVFRHALSLHDKVKWDFVQIQLNFVDWRHAEEISKRNVNAETLYAMLAEKNIPVIVMEPLLGGKLANFNLSMQSKLTPIDPEASPAKWAFRFAGTHPGVLTVLSGMSRLEHIEENIKTFSPLKPLSANEFVAIERAARAYLSDDWISCTACNYCMPCPYGLDIPGIFTTWNDSISNDRLPNDETLPEYSGQRRKFLIDYERAIPKLRRAERCTGCGRCLSHCPQSIDIPLMLQKVDKFIEKLRRNGRA